MSVTLNPGYRYLPYVRLGAAANQRAPASGAANATLTVPVAAKLEQAGKTTEVKVDSPSLALVGPGDIVSLDAGEILHHWPPNQGRDVEVNYFPQLVLRSVDLPWRYSPAVVSNEQLSPWLCLLVLCDDEIEDWQPSQSGKQDRRLPHVVVKEGTPLPDLRQAWAWAHAQVSGIPTGTASPLTLSELQEHPDRFVSRLLCPRRLDVSKAWRAMVVPVYDRGRQSGLGEDIKSAWNALSWTTNAAPKGLTLPVYYSWRFTTSNQPLDFEAMASRLAPRAIPDGVGLRAVRVELPTRQGATDLAVAGALKLPGRSPAGQVSRAAFAELLGLDLVTPPNADPVIRPPLYGRYHSNKTTLNISKSIDNTDHWFDQLNADPAWRIVAGLGAEVVRRNQESYRADAWEQLDQVREANRRLQQKRASLALNQSLLRRHLEVGNPLKWISRVAPLVDPAVRTACLNVLELNGIPRATLDPQSRRIFRPRGPITRRAGSLPLGLNNWSKVLDRKLTLPVITVAGLSDALSGSAPNTINSDVLSSLGLTELPSSLSGINLTPSSGVSGVTPGIPAGVTVPLNFGTAEPAGAVSISSTRTGLSNALTPRRLADDLKKKVRDGLGARGGSALAGIQATPQFPHPTFEKLEEVDPGWILPGWDQLPTDLIALAEANQAFVEAFLLGMNVEIASEMVWREYPTDQRGTGFRHFWNLLDSASGASATAEDIKDIWSGWRAGRLGTHAGAGSSTSGALILLIRSELVRRYPNLIVSAVKASWTGKGPGYEDKSTTTRKEPVLAQRLGADIALFGFSGLDQAEARGSKNSAHPGWYFVLQEQPHEPRFGLNVPDGKEKDLKWKPDWASLSWAHLAEGTIWVDAASAPRGLKSWSTDKDGASATAADLAAATLQKLALVAIHGSLLLP